MQKIIPCLWFDNEAEEAAKFYTKLFKNSKINKTNYYNVDTPSNKPIGSVLTVDFEIEGHKFLNLNGGQFFKINPSISFIVSCETIKEIDNLWNNFTKGGKILMEIDKYPFSERYGWVEDKFGVSWQLILNKTRKKDNPKIVPSLLFVGDKCGKAEEAIDFYTSIFKNSKKENLMLYGKGQEPNKENHIMFADFKIENYWIAIMDSANDHKFNFNEGISLIIYCKDQKEIDYFYDKLSANPKAEICGWLKDKYGVSWQLATPDIEKLTENKNVMKELLKMKRININKLKEVYDKITNLFL